jgi:uncharacterized membrane protein
MQTTFSREFPDADQRIAKLGRGLGLFSIGLGLAEVAAPDAIARLIGVECRPNQRTAIRACGLREIATGVGLLARPRAAGGAWARVFGDAIDLALLAYALRSPRTERARTLGAIGIVAGAAAIDAVSALRMRRGTLGEPVRRAVTINRPASEVYARFRDFSRLPEFMSWVVSVQERGDGLSHWRVRTPAGGTIEYDAELIEDTPDRRIEWRSLPGARVPNRGVIAFMPAPGDRGTEVILEIQVGLPLAKLIAGAEAEGDLRRLKQVIEAGEVTRSDASIHRMPHPAQPSGTRALREGGGR